MIEISVKLLRQYTVVILIIIASLSIWIGSLAYELGLRNGYRKGWDEGAEKGICAALDTVKTILDTKSFDTNTVKAVHLNDDTIWYNLRLLDLKNSIK